MCSSKFYSFISLCVHIVNIRRLPKRPDLPYKEIIVGFRRYSTEVHTIFGRQLAYDWSTMSNDVRGGSRKPESSCAIYGIAGSGNIK